MYFEEAKKRLEEEAKSGKFGQKEAAMVLLVTVMRKDGWM